MSRRVRDDGVDLSLESFLDTVTNVVGVLVLIALVTVLGAGEIGVPAMTTTLKTPKPTATRVLFECRRGQVFFVDEAENAKRVRDAVDERGGNEAATAESVTAFLHTHDVGDATYRVRADWSATGVVWTYTLRDDARGTPAAELGDDEAKFIRKLEKMPKDSFAYFVVHEDSFDVFRRAREIAASRGIAVGWHPVEGDAPMRIGRSGTLGKQVQ